LWGAQDRVAARAREIIVADQNTHATASKVNDNPSRQSLSLRYRQRPNLTDRRRAVSFGPISTQE
jgi:hypothetical protein